MREIKFKDFIKLNRGFDLPNDKMVMGDFPVVASTSIKGYHDEYKVLPPVVVTGRSGSLGSVQYIEKACTPLNTTLYVKDFKGNDPKYVYYYLKMMHLESFNSGAGVPTLNQNHLHGLKLKIHELQKQKKVANVLSAYDDLIEANNRRIELLEQTAQELYKEWFVRFRFPGYESAKFENGLPEGWELKKIGDIAHVKSGYAFKSEWWINEGVPVVKIKDIQGNTIDFGDLSHVSEDHAEIAKQFYIVEGDLLIAMTGATIGKMALVPYSEKQMVVNQRVGKFFLGESPAEKVAFLYMTLQQNWVQELIVMIAGSNAAQPNISPFDIEKIKVVYNEDMVDEYNRRSAPFIEEILQLRKQNQNLATQRDMLLPRLMSGKLEVN
ncbi:MAG: restriction endonuclease subunit S [Bacillota bacterium]|nr:restriction endonuclease subunit S [Bacillota bacterium]